MVGVQALVTVVGSRFLLLRRSPQPREEVEVVEGEEEVGTDRQCPSRCLGQSHQRLKVGFEVLESKQRSSHKVTDHQFDDLVTDEIERPVITFSLMCYTTVDIQINHHQGGW